MIFNRIKLNYNIKLFEDLFANRNYKEIHKQLKNIKGNKPLFFDIVKFLYNKYLQLHDHIPFHKNKFVWIISYDLSDTEFLNKFINFYMDKQTINFSLNKYRYFTDKLISEFSNDNFPVNPSFEDVIENSGFYQLLILLLEESEYIISSTNAAFFEAPNNKFLIYPQNTASYIFIIRDPLSLYSRKKLLGSNSQEALNHLINHIDDNNFKTSKYFFYENKQNWQVNSNSWIDDNVVNTYRGKIIKFENIIHKTEETLVEVIYHLKQSGININVDHKIIEDFLNKNPLPLKNTEEQFSNKEVKSIYSNIDKELLMEFNYNTIVN